MPRSEQPDPYDLIIAPTARRQLTEVLAESVAFAAYDFVTGPLLENPHRVGKELHAPLDNHFSARRGTYRIIYTLDDEQRVVTVVAGVAPRRMVGLAQIAHTVVVQSASLARVSGRSSSFS